MTEKERALVTVAHAALLAFLQLQDKDEEAAFETLSEAYDYASQHLKQYAGFQDIFEEYEDE